ncbi:MAG: pyrroline-5-carboxylate reductase [Candidatus Aminicenantes bacterium]|nr:MAG: pyrroline-5-carboxylate reductase [Candidatus Aminicenantes bacterium]
MSIKNKPIAFIGGGHITEIILENLTTSKVVAPENLIVSDPDKVRLEKLNQKFSVQKTADNTEAVNWGDFVFINVRPQVVKEVVDELSLTPILEEKVFVTVAAGIPMDKYYKLGKELPVVRAVPNPPSQIGLGIIAMIFNEFVSEIQKEEILELFDSLGEVVLMKEEHINAATALSSPASVLLFFSSLIDAGARIGMDREMSIKIVYQTIVGALAVWKQHQVPVVELLDKTCTPGGISEESVLTLEKHGFQAAISEAIQSAAIKAEQLGKKIKEER